MCETIFHNLGPGHTESIYHNAMEVELRESKLTFGSHPVFPVLYKHMSIGHLIPDFVIYMDNKDKSTIVIELKALKNITESWSLQLQKYKQTCKSTHEMLINFGHDSVSGYSLNETSCLNKTIQ